MICKWMKQFYKDNNKYPYNKSGTIIYAKDDGYLDNPTWNGVSMALKIGLRGLSGNITLSDLKNKIIENKDNGL